MRVLILTCSAQVHATIIIRKIYDGGFRDMIIFSSLEVFPKKSLLGSLSKIVKDSGFKYLTYRILNQLHNEYLVFSGVEEKPGEFAKKHSIPFEVVSDVNSSGTLKKLIDFKPDLIISLYFNQILQRGLLHVPPKGCINVHRAFLPRYRGPNSLFWQFANNEIVTGTTIHYVDEGVDSGPVIIQEEFPITKSDTLYSTSKKHAEVSGRLLLNVLPKIERNTVSPRVQNGHDATVYGFPTPDAMEKFLFNSKRFF